MSRIGVTLSAPQCVRALSKASSCDACMHACPTGAIKVEAGALPLINLSQCVGCGACVGVCPSEALKVDGFESVDFLFTQLSQPEPLISCRVLVPCLSILHVEYIIALALLKKEVIFDMGHCDACALGPTCKPLIERHCEEASYLLEALHVGAVVRMEARGFEPEESSVDRRAFLQNLNVAKALEARARFEREVELCSDELITHSVDSDQIAQLRRKEVGEKRKMLLTALRRAGEPKVYHVVEAEALTFTSQKRFDLSTCTACQMCYRLCPTGALSSDLRHSKIDFDPMLCIKCALCHDVCESDALSLSGVYALTSLYQSKPQRLVDFRVKMCHECGCHFVSLHGENYCRRCDIEEDEAKALWGIEDE
ncbi:MAG: 4Fe-4S binding protein [Campylobacterales bacterium]|nr:4Fe-4S binding protein [Campylobacterales bacterium]